MARRVFFEYEAIPTTFLSCMFPFWGKLVITTNFSEYMSGGYENLDIDRPNLSMFAKLPKDKSRGLISWYQ